MFPIHSIGIALLASLTVSLWTVRVALTARGRRLAAAAVASVEAVLFTVVFARALGSLDSPVDLTAYGGGVGIGTLVGLTIDQRLDRACKGRRPSGRSTTVDVRRPAAALQADHDRLFEPLLGQAGSVINGANPVGGRHRLEQPRGVPSPGAARPVSAAPRRLPAVRGWWPGSAVADLPM